MATIASTVLAAMRAQRWRIPRHAAPAGARRVKLVCASCGAVAAVVDQHPDGARFADYPHLRLVIRAGNRAYRHARDVRCRAHGPLGATWAVVLPAAAAAAGDGRVRTLRLSRDTR